MATSFQFYLSGFGQLTEILTHEKIIARIQVVLLPDESKQWPRDHVILDCEASTITLWELLSPLHKACLEGFKVMMKFQAVYSHLGICHMGWTPEDPSHMLHVYGQLVNVEQWYCDGKVPSGSVLSKKTASSKTLQFT